uniref:Uncharacterized protein n=1 Tax=Moniliophthora roreri TaxID=221103 RepID=A0A0W0G1V7_MONRR
MSNSPIDFPTFNLTDNTVCIRNASGGVGIPVYPYQPFEIMQPVQVYDPSIGNTLGSSVVPIFNGDNFREWKCNILAYLNLARASYALTNTMPQPVASGNTMTLVDPELVKEWRTLNAQALGLFQLKLSPTLQ